MKRVLCGWSKKECDAPKDEFGVGHEIGDALQHASRFEDERRECHPVKVHPNSESVCIVLRGDQ